MNDVTREHSTRRRLRSGVLEVVVIEFGILLSFSVVVAELSRMQQSAAVDVPQLANSVAAHMRQLGWVPPPGSGPAQAPAPAAAAESRSRGGNHKRL